ncbi:MAG: hypothetical protein ABW000_16940 [Actinoplanes sp.]
MNEPEVGKVVRGLWRSRAILTAVLPALLQQRRAVKVALEAMEVLYPGHDADADADAEFDVDEVHEWLIVGQGTDGRELFNIAVPKLNRQSRVGLRRSRSSSTDDLLDSEIVASYAERRESGSLAGDEAITTSSRPAEPVEIRKLTEWVLAYLREHEGEHFSVRRLREQLMERLRLTPEQVEHERFRLALVEARAQDQALVQPNRKAWMYRRGMGEPRGEDTQ